MLGETYVITGQPPVAALTQWLLWKSGVVGDLRGSFVVAGEGTERQFDEPLAAWASRLPETLLAPPAPGFGAWQYQSAGAFDGSRYLVAWHDHRNGDQGSAWAAFLDPSGARVGDDFEVLTSSGHKEIGDVEFDGTNFVVALETNGRVVLQRVTPTGRLLDPVGIQVSEPWVLEGVPRLASHGGVTVVVWAENRSPVTELRAARVGSDGVVLDPGGVVVQSSMTSQLHQPDVAFDGADFVVVWREAPRSLFLARLSPTLSVQAPGPQLIHTAAAGDLVLPRVNALAGPAMLSFLQGDDEDQLRPFLVRGQPAAMPVPLSTEVVKGAPVDLQFDGANYLAVWVQRDDRSVRALNAPPSLSPVTPGGVVLASGAEGSPATVVLGGASAGLVTWQDGARQLVFKAVVTPATLALTSAGPIVNTSGAQVDPSLAVAPGRSLHAWSSPRYPTGTLVQLAVRTAVGPAVTDVSMSSTSTESPSVAASDTELLVAWMSDGRILARRFSLDGAPLDAQPLTVCEADGEYRTGPVAVFDGTSYVIGFFSKDVPPYRLRVATVGKDGVVAMPCGQVVATTEPNTSNGGLSAATGGGTTVFVWEQRDNEWAPTVRVVRTRGGAVVDATPLALARRLGATPSAAWNGTDFVVAWSDERRGRADVRFARLPVAGAPRDPDGVVVSALDVDQRSPRVAFDGRRYLLVWSDARSGQDDLRGAYVAADLSVSTDDLPVAASTDLELDARVAARGPGRFVVGYTRFDRTPGVVALRAAARDVVSLDPGAACADSRECATGFCVDGVCCDSACGGGASDCQACSVATGAPADGTCTVLPAQTTCRQAASTCDVAEVCDGTSPTCGADAVAPDGLACQAGAGVCRSGMCRTEASPRFTSPVTVSLTCGETWRYSSAGRPTVAGQGPFTFAARTASGEALPEGFVLDPMTGELSWRTTRDSPAALTVELRVESPTGFDTQTVQLEVECQPRNHRVGCSASDGAHLAVAALLLLARRRRAG